MSFWNQGLVAGLRMFAGRLRVLLDTKSTCSFLIVSANALLSSFAFWTLLFNRHCLDSLSNDSCRKCCNSSQLEPYKSPYYVCTEIEAVLLLTARIPRDFLARVELSSSSERYCLACPSSRSCMVIQMTGVSSTRAKIPRFFCPVSRLASHFSQN